jgi:RNA polymerase sigma-70 factor (ECF subfamily)
VFRAHWWAAVATVARLVGDLEIAEDAVQDACAAALTQWPAGGTPDHPRAWLIGVARHKATDRLRRESHRADKEAAAMRDGALGWATAGDGSAASGLVAASPAGELPPAAGVPVRDGPVWDGPVSSEDDELGLILACCHPALDPAVRVPLTLRSVCGLPTAEIAAAFLVPEPTMAQRLVRAKRKIRQAGISLALPAAEERAGRLGGVLRVVYLVFTAGHKPSAGDALVRGDLCEQAIRLARALAALAPGDAEVTGLLALLLLTDARRGARVGPAGDLVLLADQDRSRWDRAKIAEGAALLGRALRARRPGPYQLQAAIAACHSCATSAADTDWAEIAALYGALLRYEPTPVVAANRAAAVAMAEGPAAGLALLDEAAADRRLARWPQLHIARAELLGRLGRRADASRAYQAALDLAPAAPERDFIGRRLRELAG